jgi:hypothetical protein
MFFIGGNVASAALYSSYTGILAAFFVLAFLVGYLATLVVARQARHMAEKDFALIAHRLARSADSTVPAVDVLSGDSRQRHGSDLQEHLST